MSNNEPKKRPQRGVKWRKCCGRKHASTENCLLVRMTTRSKAGNPVSRFIHIDRLNIGEAE